MGVTAANVHDKLKAISLKEQVKGLNGVKKILADGYYQGIPPFTGKGRTEWEIGEMKTTGGRFKVLSKRWMVE